MRSAGLTRITSEPSPARVGRNGSRSAAACSAQLEHALVELDELGDRARLAGGAEVRLERDRVERDEAVDELAHLAGRAQQADVGPAVGDDGEVGEVGAQDRAHERHRLAPRAPAADADGHAVAQLGDDLVLGHAACRPRGHCSPPSGLATKSSRQLVGDAGEVELEREALLEAVAALHVPRVDAVERLLGRPDDRRGLRGDLAGDLEGGARAARSRGTTSRTEPYARQLGGRRRSRPCRPSRASCAAAPAGPGGWPRRARRGRPRAARSRRRPLPRSRRRCRPARCRRRGRSRAPRRSPGTAHS